MTFRKLLTKGTRPAFYLLGYGCAVHCFGEYVAELVVCNGPSMEPTLFTDDIIISEHITTRFLGQFDRGDIVLFRSPTDPKTLVLKRIVATPGNKIRSSNLENNIIPKGHLWVEGDNKINSTDSRDYGPVSQGLVRGRALCRIWPPSSFQFLTSST